MKKVTFYIMPETENAVHAALPHHHRLACKLASELYQQEHRVFIYTTDETQANAIDEYLWQLDASSFVPHNLQGEGPRNGAPVEIGFQPPRQRYQILINLHDQTPPFAINFNQVIDFVPHQDDLKQQARERYKHYRQTGLQLLTVNAE
jgi:DNA polymerase-3 subunit chi